jgi:hypothetical protein
LIKSAPVPIPQRSTKPKRSRARCPALLAKLFSFGFFVVCLRGADEHPTDFLDLAVIGIAL